MLMEDIRILIIPTISLIILITFATYELLIGLKEGCKK